MSEVLKALQLYAVTRPDAIAVEADGERLSYRKLLRRVAGCASGFLRLPDTIGLLAPNGIDWVIADLASMAAGKTLVPLPPFFSADQMHHIVQDAGIEIIVAPSGYEKLAAGGGVPVQSLNTSHEAKDLPVPPRRACRIIYTSGTTGCPKGVVHGQPQLDFSAHALMQVIQATPDDIHLSLLPFALLLEQICGIHVPLLAGARTVLATRVATACGQGMLGPLAETMAQVKPTTSVLVPQQLSGWCAQLSALQQPAPDSLRFVAVGGAPVSVALAEAAWGVGIPVYEGYGLSECCSVVAVNRPGARKPGTVGQPLPGVSIELDNGEIVVRSPGLMVGYTHAAPLANPVWRTGDAGELDADGNIVVLGRKDDMLVTSYGRNIHPAWIEAMVLADSRFSHCVALGHGEPHLTLAVALSSHGQVWFSAVGCEGVSERLSTLTAEAPAYARPARFTLLTTDQASDPALFTGNGRPRRKAFSARFARAASLPISR